MQEITPFLWFDSNAEGAVNFYVSIFPNSRIASTNRYGEEGAKASGKAAGSVMTMSFVLNGQEFIALNGGPGRTEKRRACSVVKSAEGDRNERPHREAD